MTQPLTPVTSTSSAVVVNDDATQLQVLGGLLRQAHLLGTCAGVSPNVKDRPE